MATIAAILATGQNYQQAGDLSRAEKLYREVLNADPRNADAWYLLGSLGQSMGRTKEAASCYRQALAIKPEFAQAFNGLGIALTQQNRMWDALECFRQAVHVKPDYAQAFNNLGNVLKDMGQDGEALASYRRAIFLKPDFAEAFNNLANILRINGQLEEAAASCEQALGIRPDFAEAHNNMGAVLFGQKKIPEAIACYQQAMRLKPDFAEAHNNLGVALAQRGKTEEAKPHFRQAIRLQPHCPEWHNNLGNALKDCGEFEEAAACCREAIRLKPGLGEAHSNLGLALMSLGRLDEALAACQRGLQLQPNEPNAHGCLGLVLAEQGKTDQALACYRRALQAEPQNPEAHRNRSLVWLLLGNFEEGWPEYEWRWQCKELPLRPFRQLVWDGAPLQGRSILLHAEQGLGDTLQFIRYAREVKQCGGKVAVVCQPALVRLLQGSPEIDHVCAQGDSLPSFDVHAPLLSLPGILGTTLASVPAHVPYLHADPQLLEQWQRYFSPLPSFKIGIAWQGNPKYRGDRQRSIPLAQFEPLARVPGVQLFSLQKGHGSEQLGQVDFGVVDLGSRLDGSSGAFMDTAAVMKQLDLVISSDTAIPHLAGGLGVPVWLGLAQVPDWRWLLEREDSPWYPSMRLFRQMQQGDWEEVFRRMAHVLKESKTSQASGKTMGVKDRINKFAMPKTAMNTARDGLVSQSTNELLARARQSHQGGLLAEAESIYRRILAAEPANAHVWYLLGACCQAQGKLEEAIESLRQAVAVKPDHAEAHNHLGVVLAQHNHLDEAAASFREALRIKPEDAEANHNLGQALVRQGRTGEAVACFRDAIRLKPGFAEAYQNLGMALAAQEKHEEAVRCYREAIRLKPQIAQTHSFLGAALRNRGQLQEAEESCRQAVRLRPDYVEAHNNLGLALLDQGKVEDAIGCLKEAIRLKSDYSQARNNLGIAYWHARRLDDAEATLREAIRIQPDFVQAHSNLGLVLKEQGKRDHALFYFQEALRCGPEFAEGHNNLANIYCDLEKWDEAVAGYLKAVQLKPDYAQAHNNLGMALRQQGKLSEAAASLREAIRLKPDYPEAQNNLGLTYMKQGKHDEAVTSFKQAIRLRPEYPEAHNHLGMMYWQNGQNDEAAASIEEALRLRPAFAEAHNNLGSVFNNVGKYQEALASYEDALRNKPEMADGHWNRSLIWLCLGNFEQGWPEYEWRWKCKVVTPRPFRQPIWDGSQLEGRTILLHAEQGLGDTFQFIRYASLVKERGGKVVFECQRALVGLIKACQGIDDLVIHGQPLPAFDVHAPLLSLPGILGTTLASVPAHVPYLHADPQLLEQWQRYFSPLPSFKIGIAWQGNPKYRGDRQRSIPLAQFEPLARVPGVQLFSLQKGHGSEQLGQVEFGVVDLGSRLDGSSGAFMDTAAVMKQLDLVISSDTAIPHLAGGLGVPVWLGLAQVPDWRWLLEREDSPWYPSMRLFRQVQQGDWEGVFKHMAQVLKDLPAVQDRHAISAEELNAATSSLPPLPPEDLSPAGLELLLSRGRQSHRAGLLTEAESIYRRIVTADPGNAHVWYLLGICCQGQGKLFEAINSLKQCLSIKSDHAEAHNHLGVVLAQQNCLEEAANSFRDAIRLKPEDPEANHNLGQALMRQGHPEEAVASFREAVRLKPEFAEAHHNLGQALATQEKHEEAIGCYQEAIRLKPDFAPAYNNWGTVLRRLGRLEEAVESCRRAVQLWPTYIEAHNNLGLALLDQAKVEEAIACLKEAIRIKPDYAQALNNLGIAFWHQGRLQEAAATLQEALAHLQDFPEAHNNLGSVLRDLGRFDEGADHLQQALALKPDYPDAHWNRSLSWLLLGKMEQGWQEYEWRWKKVLTPRNFTQPVWDGSPLDGKTILLHAEQGLGDTLQFIRYAPLVKERGGKVIVECQDVLIKLLPSSPGIDQLVAKEKQLPSFDVHAPLLSLPGIFGTTLASVPAHVPYLHADPQLLEQWQRYFSPLPSFKIGIAWQGNPKYRGDRQRSIPLAQFEPLARVPGVQLFSLQKGHGSEQLGQVDFGVLDLGSRLDGSSGAFMDTAAVMKQLDLVISSDTAIPHLAGGLGVPVWLGLAQVPDWRWLLEREDSPWYPSMRLFRQMQQGDWEGVFRRMAQALRALPALKGGGHPVLVEIGMGELFDKITILEIKSKRITDPGKLQNVIKELKTLTAVRQQAVEASPELTRWTEDLRAVNEALWQIEDEIRSCEKANDFGAHFIELARSVYRQNDRRAALKRQINDLLGSRIIEEKAYKSYSNR